MLCAPPQYPPFLCPRSFIPGGSSSGSGAAVGAGMVSFALATDTAGSGRVPAGYNGLVGVKGTVGYISTVGEQEWKGRDYRGLTSKQGIVFAAALLSAWALMVCVGQGSMQAKGRKAGGG